MTSDQMWDFIDTLLHPFFVVLHWMGICVISNRTGRCRVCEATDGD